MGLSGGLVSREGSGMSDELDVRKDETHDETTEQLERARRWDAPAMFAGVREQVGEFAEAAIVQAKEMGGVALDKAQQGIDILAGKAVETQREIRKALYNPLFPEEFVDRQLDLPKLIVIVDDDERKGIDVCEGAIGWIDKHAGIEVLHLYDSFVAESGLTFAPVALCYSAYHVDPFDPRLYVNLSSYFETMHRDKITELRNVAFLLGAKACRLEAFEEQKTIVSTKAKAKAKAKSAGEAKAGAKGAVEGSAEWETQASLTKRHEILLDQSFEEGRAPQKPDLHWYAHDREINSLIAMRLSGSGDLKRYSSGIDLSLSETMSGKLAAKIGGALEKMGFDANFSLEGESLSESRQKLKFFIEF